MLLIVCATATVSSLPIISPALENNPDHLVWEALLTIDTRYADQDKTRKIPKSIFITPNLNESKVSCLPGHRLGPDGKCYKTLNIDPLDILKTQIASLYSQNRNKTTTPVVDYDDEYDYSDYDDSTESINNKYEVPLSLGFAGDHRPPKYPNKVADDNSHKIVLGDVIVDREPFHNQPFLVGPVELGGGHKPHKHHPSGGFIDTTSSTTSTTTEATTTTTIRATTTRTTTIEPIVEEEIETTTSEASTAASTTSPPSPSEQSNVDDDVAGSTTAKSTVGTGSIIDNTTPIEYDDQSSVAPTTEPYTGSSSTVSTIHIDVRASTVPNAGQSAISLVESSTESVPISSLNDNFEMTSESTQSTITENYDTTTMRSSVEKSTTAATQEIQTSTQIVSSTDKMRNHATSEPSLFDSFVASASSILSTVVRSDETTGVEQIDDHDDDDDVVDDDDAIDDHNDDHPLSSENSVDPIDFINHIEKPTANRRSDHMVPESNSVDITLPESSMHEQPSYNHIEIMPSSVPLVALALKAETTEPSTEKELPTQTQTQSTEMPTIASSTSKVADATRISSSSNDETHATNTEIEFDTELHFTSTVEPNKKSKIYEYITANAASAIPAQSNNEDHIRLESIATSTTSDATLPTQTHGNIVTEFTSEATYPSSSSGDELELNDSEGGATTPSTGNESIEVVHSMGNYQYDDMAGIAGNSNEEANLNARLVDESFFQGSNMMLAALANLDNDTMPSIQNITEYDIDPSQTGSTIMPDTISLEVASQTYNNDDVAIVTETNEPIDLGEKTTPTPPPTPSSTSSSTPITELATGTEPNTILSTIATRLLSINHTKNHSRHDRTSNFDRIVATSATDGDADGTAATTAQPAASSSTPLPSDAPFPKGIGEKSDVNIKLGINCYLKNYLKHFYIMCT